MQRFMVYVLSIYMIVLVFGMNFFLTGISFGLLGPELLLFGFLALLPGLFLLIYVFRANIGNLENHERALHYLIYISLAVAVVVTSVIIAPTVYS